MGEREDSKAGIHQDRTCNRSFPDRATASGDCQRRGMQEDGKTHAETACGYSLWTPMPNLEVEPAWILAGGAHHTAFTYDLTAEQIGDWGAAWALRLFTLIRIPISRTLRTSYCGTRLLSGNPPGISEKEWRGIMDNGVIEKRRNAIAEGRTTLGIELGSTRIKAVLMDENYEAIATGKHDWENRYVDNIWTYTLDDIWGGVQDSYRNLKQDVKNKYGITLTTAGAIGFSAMMHGYMVFNKNGDLLVPFRTWRNTITGPASDKLTELFQYNIPQRWSVPICTRQFK